MCYIIDIKISYNRLLGRPWIHRNGIVLSTLHQVMKYIDKQSEVRTLVADRHPFKMVENYFNDSIVYQDSLETGPDTEHQTLGTRLMKS